MMFRGEKHKQTTIIIQTNQKTKRKEKKRKEKTQTKREKEKEEKKNGSVYKTTSQEYIYIIEHFRNQ